MCFTAFLDARPTIHRISKRTSRTYAILWFKPRPKIAIERPMLERVIASRISKSCRIVLDITIEINARRETNRVFADEPSDRLVVISSAVIVEASFRVKFAAGILERVGERAAGVGQLAEGIIGVRLRYRAR